MLETPTFPDVTEYPTLAAYLKAARQHYRQHRGDQPKQRGRKSSARKIDAAIKQVILHDFDGKLRTRWPVVQWKTLDALKPLGIKQSQFVKAVVQRASNEVTRTSVLNHLRFCHVYTASGLGATMTEKEYRWLRNIARDPKAANKIINARSSHTPKTR